MQGVAVSPAQLASVYAALRDGASLRVACEAASVSPRTLVRLRAERPEVEEAVLVARAAFEAVAVARISTAGADDWRAAAWMLERLRPERYGARHKVEVASRVVLEWTSPLHRQAEPEPAGEPAQESAEAGAAA